MIQYDGHILEYIEESQTIQNQLYHTCKMSFDHGLFYHVKFPLIVTDQQSWHHFNSYDNARYPPFASGMEIYIDDRSPNHPSIAFAFSILKYFGYPQNEAYWHGLMTRGADGMECLSLIFEKIRTGSDKGRAYRIKNFQSLAKQQTNHFSDIEIETQ